MTRWGAGERAVVFLLGQGRLEGFAASDPAELADVLIERAGRRLEATATATLANGDADGAYAAAYDTYRMAGEALLARQQLRATGGDGSHMAVEDAVSAVLRQHPRVRQARLRTAPPHPAQRPVLRPGRPAHHRS